MTPEWITAALEIAGIAGGVIGAVSTAVTWWLHYAMVSVRDFTAYRERHEKQHDALDRRLDEGARKFDHLDGDLRNRPDGEQILALRAVIAKLDSELSALREFRHGTDERFGRLESSVDRILDYHLRGK